MSIFFNTMTYSGEPWNGNLHDYIKRLSITFHGAGIENSKETESLKKGDVLLKDITLNYSGWELDIYAIHPITAKVFQCSLKQSGRNMSYPVASKGIVKLDFLPPENPITKLSTRVSPEVVKFFDIEKSEEIVTNISTITPIVTTPYSDRITIELDSNFNEYVYVEDDGIGFTSINGLAPVQGNINMRGVGDVVVRVSNNKGV